jgi:hypothetical protein
MTASCRGRRARQWHTRGRAGERKAAGDGKRLRHMWPGASGMAARWRHSAGMQVSRPRG